jgi:hypothetical protein
MVIQARAFFVNDLPDYGSGTDYAPFLRIKLHGKIPTFVSGSEL